MEKFGYSKSAHLKNIGQKFGKILDVVVYQKEIWILITLYVISLNNDIIFYVDLVFFLKKQIIVFIHPAF
jgi:hypothetical protein